MKIILAVDENWGIGKDNDMLFAIKEDLKHFRESTTGGICIMGRQTYQSIGKPLENRENIVVSTKKDLTIKGAKVFNQVSEVLEYVKNKDKEVFVIGGAKIVDLFIDYCNQAIITKIHAKKDADTFLHNFDKDENFEIIEKSEIKYEDGLSFEYIIYGRK